MMKRFALLLLVTSCAPEAGRPTAGTGAPGNATLEAATARLPEQIADFNRRATTWLERQRPGDGVMVEFAGPAQAAVATVSLYDRAQGRVNGHAGDPRVAREFSEAVREVVAIAGTRTSQQLAERERRDIAVPGGAPLSCSWFDGTYGRENFRTLLCLGAAAGHFIKLQVTSPARPVRPVDPMPFVVEATRAVRGAG